MIRTLLMTLITIMTFVAASCSPMPDERLDATIAEEDGLTVVALIPMPKTIDPRAKDDVTDATELPRVNTIHIQITDKKMGVTWSIPLSTSLYELVTYTWKGLAPGDFRVTVSGYWNANPDGVFPSGEDDPAWENCHLLMRDSVDFEYGLENDSVLVELKTPASNTGSGLILDLYPSSSDGTLTTEAPFSIYEAEIEYIHGYEGVFSLLDLQSTISSRASDSYGYLYTYEITDDIPVGSGILSFAIKFPNGQIRRDADVVKIMPGLISRGNLYFDTDYEE